MLMQFNFKNHKTYLNDTSFDMKALNLKDHCDNVVKSRAGEDYLKVAAIYGANASGKTNLLDALQHMIFLVHSSLSANPENKRVPQFRYVYSEKGRNTKPTYEVFFEINEREYQYGFTLDKSSIYEEWLYKRDYRSKNKYEVVFEREKQRFNLSKSLGLMKQITDTLKEHVLLLSILSNFKNTDIDNVMTWFKNVDVLNFGNTYFEAMLERTIPSINFEDALQKKKFEEYLCSFEPGLVGVRLEKSGKKTNANGTESDAFNFYSQRKDVDSGDIIELPLQLESSGTLKMISLYDSIYEALLHGSTLFVDELDAKLHPLLTRNIINMFQNPQNNPKGAQIIFTTHDVNLLKKEYFRRDQVWFCEKDKSGVTDLYSLVEYKLDDGKKVRYDASFDRDYLSGKYGAIPLVREFGLGDDYGIR